MRKVNWGWLAVGTVLGAIVAPKLRTWFPRLPSYGNGAGR